MRDTTPRRPRRPLRRSAGMAALALLLVLTGCAGGPDTRNAIRAEERTAAETVTEQAFLPASRPTRLRIPAIDVDSSGIVDLGLKPDRTMEVPKGADAVGWYVESPTPGERGPSVLAAHVDWKNEKGVFFDLRTLRPGAEVIVDRADGSTVRFEVTLVERYPKNRFPTEKVYGNVDGAELRLITCGGEFNRAEQSYRDNVVAYASMVPAGD